jgi:hypothetical protein
MPAEAISENIDLLSMWSERRRHSEEADVDSRSLDDRSSPSLREGLAAKEELVHVH